MIFSSAEIKETAIISNDNNITKGTQTLEQTKDKVYSLGDEITINNYSDKYTLKITEIKEMNERNQFFDKIPEQVFLIDYTYKCISGETYISDMNFKIIDEQGEIGTSYPNSISNYPQNVTEGISCRAQMVLCVNNKSSKIKLQFFDNMFNSKPDATFEINL